MKTLWVFVAFGVASFAQSPENVLVVVNGDSAVSRNIADYYILKRHVPLANICWIRVKPVDEIHRADFDRQIAAPIGAFLRANRLQEKILYIVTTTGVPLRIPGPGDALGSETASVDSELTLLYSDLRGQTHRLAGSVPNPFFGAGDVKFMHSRFPIYLVTRLTGYDFADVKAIIDRGLAATNRGRFVIDLKGPGNGEGDAWLRDAARKLPPDRVVLDESTKVLAGVRDVIAYASWGSNDKARKQRTTGFQWLPGAIMTEFVSTDGRTMDRPPPSWNLGNWGDPKTWFAGSPQSMTADYLHEGATGASGHVAEPYLTLTPRPDLLLPAYYRGRNLAESYYLAIPALSWMNIVVGDPLCSLGTPK